MSLILFYDTETSDWPLWTEPSDNPNQPHIVQVAARLVDSETRQSYQSIDFIVRPASWDISPETTAIHGITTEEAERVGVDEQAALMIILVLEGLADSRVGYNEPFDSRVVRIAIKRFIDDEEAAEWKRTPTECAMKMATPICMMRDPKGKKRYKFPKLGEAYEFFTGNKMEGAHNAMADVDALIEVYFKMKEIG